MDWNGNGQRITTVFEKYKYVLIVIALGLLLMLLPSKNTETERPESTITPIPDITITEELASILGQIEGVGRVRVMITEQTGSETIYQTDEDITEETDRKSIKQETVLISGSNGENGLIKAITPPVYLGAIVVCQGADDPTVRLNIAKAVSAVMGISTDRITVLKMK